MARFTDEWLRELLAKNDIAEVIGSYVPLQKKGARFWGKCPWHPDSNPSFSVIPDKDMFYCFSCKKGGGVIQFIMETEKLSFMEAVELLAARAGMEVPQSEPDADYQKKKEQRARLSALNREAARHFYENLKTPEGKAAVQYLERRGVSSQIMPFGLGYSMNSYEDMVKHLTDKGFSVKDMVDAGLVKKGDHGYYDMFRGRVMFPIISVTGEVIGFGGRIMDKGEPKYLNSPDTPVFNKRKNLYALNSVKKKRDLKSILLVEGYMDVIGLAAAGIDSAVASLGTSFTKEQAHLIKRFTDRVYLSYDGDDPGVNAALKAVDILTSEALDVYVIVLPGGQDPDEFVREHGASAFYSQAKKALPAMMFKLSRLARDYDLKDPDQAVKYCTKAVELVRSLDNAMEKERYIRELSRQTGLSVDSISAQLGIAPKERYNIPKNEQKLIKPKTDAESRLIAMIVERPELAGMLEDVEEGDFTNENCKKIFFFAKSQIKEGIPVSGAEIVSEFSGTPELTDIALTAETDAPSGREDAARSLVSRMKLSSLSREREELLSGMEGADTAARLITLKRIDEINKRMRSIKGSRD